MAWRLFKSIRLGLARINLSRSGVGFSFGVRGLRFGISSSKRPYFSYNFGPLRYFRYLNKGSTKADNFDVFPTSESPAAKARVDIPNEEKPLTKNEEVLRKLRERT